MLINEFDYDLPPELIAQEPIEPRDASRMMVVDRAQNGFSDHAFTEITDYLHEGDVLVVNNTRVFPARLLGRSETGANVEIFLVREIEQRTWETLAKPAKRLHPGKRIEFSSDLSGEVIEKLADGKVIVKLMADDLVSAIDAAGRTPLPPYIKREGASIDRDRERYQTVYANERGAIAAPTAGLHFTPEILEKVQRKGVEIAEITLHVGYGTFEPVRVDDISEHSVAGERCSISDKAATALNAAKTEHRRIVAIGTTTTRALETALRDREEFSAGAFVADLTITPGYNFRAVDALLTNFHLPKSSLLVLTSTFGGHELIMCAYRHAVDKRYRFYSYGDCMLIV